MLNYVRKGSEASGLGGHIRILRRENLKTEYIDLMFEKL